MIMIVMILVMMMTMVTRDLEKHIIAQSVNTGHDVSNIQFDLQVMIIIIIMLSSDHFEEWHGCMFWLGWI